MPERGAMHPLCCIAADCHVSGDRSPDPDHAVGSGSGSEPEVAGVLYKWTNYGRGWRPRWFSLRCGAVSYARIRRRGASAERSGDVGLIGEESVRFLTAERMTVGVVDLKSCQENFLSNAEWQDWEFLKEHTVFSY